MKFIEKDNIQAFSLTLFWEFFTTVTSKATGQTWKTEQTNRPWGEFISIKW
jgi:hypothetical protein